MRGSKLLAAVLAAALMVSAVPKITEAKTGPKNKKVSACTVDVQKCLSESNLNWEDLKDHVVWNGNIGIGVFGNCGSLADLLKGCESGNCGEDDGKDNGQEDHKGGDENDSDNSGTGNHGSNGSGNSGKEENNGSAQKPDEDSESSSYAEKVVKLVNEEREKNGLAALEIDTKVQACANVRAKEIVSAFSHTRPNGSSCFTALSEGGVSYRYAGENIAYGYNSAKAVMNGWMNSSGHRANILSKNFTKIGVGYYEKNGVKYWTQFFIS